MIWLGGHIVHVHRGEYFLHLVIVISLIALRMHNSISFHVKDPKKVLDDDNPGIGSSSELQMCYCIFYTQQILP